jgi:multidrug resistance efflux pump
MNPPRRKVAARLSLGLAALGTLALAGVGVWAVYAYGGPKEVRASGPSDPPASGRKPFLLAHVDIEGGVVPLHPVAVNRVVEVPVKEYEAVKKGKKLLQLDDRDAQEQLARAKAALHGAQQQVSVARNLAEQHGHQVETQQELIKVREADAKTAEAAAAFAAFAVKSGTRPQVEADVDQRRYEAAKATVQAEKTRLAALKALKPDLQVKRAEEDVVAAEADVRRAEHGIEDYQVLAPSDGQVLRVQTAVGEMLGPNARQVAFWFRPDSAGLIVRAEVEQEFAGEVTANMPVEIVDDVRAGGVKWTGKVRSVSNWFTHRRSQVMEPYQFNDVRTLECIIDDVRATDGGALPRIGQRVRVTKKS